MWIIVRLVLALIALYLRLSSRSATAKALGPGGAGHVVRHKKRGGIIQHTQIGIRFRSSSHFYLGHEGRLERFCKRLGLAAEFQTGDRTFDNRIYLGCDNPAIAQALANNADLRQQLIKCFARESFRVWGDGAMLWVQLAGNVTADAWLPLLEALKGALAPAQTRFLDTFTAKAVVLEAIAWSIFAYAFGAFIEIYFQPTNDLVSPGRMVGPAAVLCLAGLCLLAVMLRVMLRGSARSPKLIAEVGLITAIGLPVASFNLLSDINRSFDLSESVIVEAKVIEKRDKYVFSRRQRKFNKNRTKSYYLYLGPASAPLPGGVSLPRRLKVRRHFWSRTSNGSILRFEIGAGRLGHPWFRNIEERSRSESPEE